MRDRHDFDGGGTVGDPFIAAFAFQSASCRALIARASASARGIRTPVWELDPLRSVALMETPGALGRDFGLTDVTHDSRDWHYRLASVSRLGLPS
jgi:hypothetical protein